MATIVERKTADGMSRYTVVVRLKGYPPQTATFERKTDARRWGEQTEGEIRQGRHFRTVEAKKHTLADLIDRYLKEGFQRKPGSRPKYEQQLTWWRGELGAFLLVDVTPARISECRAKLLEGKTYRGGLRSPATVNRYLASLSDCFTHGVKEYQWTETNPVRQVKKLREPSGRTRFLSDAERIRLLAECRNSRNSDLHLVVMVALTTGARHGEIMGLRWGDVDLERGLLIYRDTKNGTTRAAPLVGDVLATVRKRARVRRIDTDLLFPAPRKRLGDAGDIQSLSLRKAFEEALDRAGIENFRFHDLRHTAASYLAMSGATLAEIAAVLGHKTLAMVKRYAHLTEQHTSGVVNRMAARYFGA